jgi:dephospho-CoA kinase
MTELLSSDQTRSFSCDKAVSNLLTEGETIGDLQRLLGDKIVSDGTINRSILREEIFNSSKIRNDVEDVLHPKVLREAESFIQKAHSYRFVLLEIPLLYEVDFPIKREFDLVIGCSQQTQTDRLIHRRGITQEQAVKMLSSQMSVQDKIDRGDFVAWNDGALASFEQQLETISILISTSSKGI